MVFGQVKGVYKEQNRLQKGYCTPVPSSPCGHVTKSCYAFETFVSYDQIYYYINCIDKQQ